MGKSKTIPYDGELYEVSATEYTNWEDAVWPDGVDLNDPVALEWVTYDYLISIGNFVYPPKSERPNKTTAHSPPPSTGNLSNPGFRDGFPIHTYESREPAWTQSRILSERQKLLNEKEEMLRLRELAFHRKQQRQVKQFYHEDGTPYSNANYVSAMFGLFILIMITVVCCGVPLLRH